MKDQSCKTPRWRLLKAQLNNLSAIEFRQRLATEESKLIIDVRTPEEFATGHIPEAINIDYLGEGFWERIEQLDKDVPIYVYCRTSRRSIRTCTLMRNGGFKPEGIFNLDGGMIAYAELDQISPTNAPAT